MKRRIAIFASGEGTNFEAIVDSCKYGEIPAEVVALVCDRPSANVIERANNHNIITFAFHPKSFNSKSEMETSIADFLDQQHVDIICLAGYMRIISDTLLSRYEGRIINIHPSLLPAFPGANAVKQALDYGVKVFGVTIHYVDHTLDGGQIIAQQAIEYDGNDIDELLSKLHAIEHTLYPITITKLLKKNDSIER